MGHTSKKIRDKLRRRHFSFIIIHDKNLLLKMLCVQIVHSPASVDVSEDTNIHIVFKQNVQNKIIHYDDFVYISGTAMMSLSAQRRSCIYAHNSI